MAEAEKEIEKSYQQQKNHGSTKIAMWLDFEYVENNLLRTVEEYDFFSHERSRNFLNSAFDVLIFRDLLEML
jgi:hypothetical protein